jgi:hypothetical protein
VLLAFFSKITVLLLPFAFVFRFIPFTRQLGNTLIALILGANLLFPASIILVKDFHSMIKVPKPAISSGVFAKMAAARLPGGEALDFICESTIKRMMFVTPLGELMLDIIVCVPLAILGTAFELCKQTIENIVWPTLQIILMIYVNLVLILAQVAEMLGLEDVDTIFDAIYTFTKDTTDLVLLAYIDAIIIGIITIVGTRSIASALGGEYFLGSISRLV